MVDAEVAGYVGDEAAGVGDHPGTSIEQIGIDGTMKLKMTDLYGDLTKSGVIPTVIVTEDSIFAAPFYPTATPTKGRTPAGGGTHPEQPVDQK